MSNLYLTCGLCGRKQADGLLSRGAWGHHDAGAYGTLRACPTCKAQHDDWPERLVNGLNGAPADAGVQLRSTG
jgi:hypothetical protein